MDLVAAIRHAFTKFFPPAFEEVTVSRQIAEHPGISYQDLLDSYGKGDLSLVIGHLVYNRYGCFRKFMKDGEDQSSVLILKDRTGNSVRYRLRAEAESVLRDIGII